MKKLCSLLLISFLIGTGTLCNAQTLSAEDLKVLVENQIKTDMQRYSLDEIEVKVNNAPVSNLAVPDGKISVNVTSNSNGLNPKEYKKVNILVNKKIVRTIYLQTEIKAYKNVVVAKEMISKDKAISYQSVELKKVDVLKHIGETLSPEDLSRGLLAKKVFYPNEIITKRYTASRPDVIKDSIVSVNFITGNSLSIIVEGIAMNQGSIGDTVQVKNKRLNKVYTGVVTGENRVEIQI